jgi:hypothetical protein
MFQEDYYSVSYCNDFDGSEHNNYMDKMIENAKRMDKGYNVIYRTETEISKNKKYKKKRIEIYTSSGTGNHIRNPETGDYSNYLVGSKDEDLFFKVMLATGECRSKNGSNTLFYDTPRDYATHLKCSVDPQMVAVWEEKRQARLSVIGK